MLKVKTELILTYRPWCPTLLDEQLNVIEWGDCMDYCPTEPVNSACLEEPEFPLFSDGTGLTENFTSTYERGSGIVTDEVFFCLYFYYLPYHSSEIRGFCLMKWPSKMHQNLPYFGLRKPKWFFS